MLSSTKIKNIMKINTYDVLEISERKQSKGNKKDFPPQGYYVLKLRQTPDIHTNGKIILNDNPFTLVVFELSHSTLFNLIESTLLKYNNIAEIAKDYICILGNHQTKQVEPYYLMTKENGQLRHMIITKRLPDGSGYIRIPATSKKMSLFVHPDEDQETVFKREYNKKVKPFLIQHHDQYNQRRNDRSYPKRTTRLQSFINWLRHLHRR